MKYISVILSIVALIIVESVSAEDWTVNPADYEFSMSVTGLIELDQEQINDENTTLGAFVGDSCVGVCQPTEHSGSFELFLLTIYSNSSTGELIEFKFLDSDSQELILENEMLFQSNAIIGSVDNPFVWMETASYSPSDFLSFSHPEQIGNAEINSTVREINLVVDYQTDLESFSSNFQLSPGAKAYVNDILQVSGENSLDFSETITYRVDGVDGSSENWQVSVQLDESAVDLIETLGISVFPNPATEYVNIQIPDNHSISEISVWDMNNKLLLKYTDLDNNNLFIPFNQLSDGIYLLNFRLKNHQVLQHKVLKIK
ncbi:MAG: T9SS type A sorting domain-containing protein [Bacteroidota bacterium]|nr:T9SS type A sorting domain-containing protein [Bacteroidota bacterium]